MCLYLCLNKKSDGSEVTVCVFLDHTVITKPLTKTENIHFEKDTISKLCLVLKNVMQTGYVCVCVRACVCRGVLCGGCNLSVHGFIIER